VIYRFGGFELDRARFRLARGEESVPLQPRVLDLLAYLVERHGRLVTKQELLRELWGDRFVGDGVLTSCVYEARQALGECEGSERFIQTVHGRGYRFAAGVETLDGGEAAAATVASDPIPSPPTQASLAVLPFSDLSPGRDQGWFCEGVAEELIATLSEVRGLRVVSRASTSQFRDQDPRSIGERLRVAMLLTGSVRTAGNCLRITTQLVQVSDGSVVASSRYDREMEDIFAMQEAIARWVIEAVEGRFGGRVTPPQLRRPTASVEAYHLYLKGRYHEKRRTPSALHEALRCFEQAVAVDPGFAEGYVGQAVNVPRQTQRGNRESRLPRGAPRACRTRRRGARHSRGDGRASVELPRFQGVRGADPRAPR
jgi:TolB-like protein